MSVVVNISHVVFHVNHDIAKKNGVNPPENITTVRTNFIK